MDPDQGIGAENERNTVRLLEHKAWAWIGSVLGVAGLAISLIQVVDGWREQPAQLQVQSIQFVPPLESGTQFSRTVELSPDQLEVAIKNSGDAVSSIEQVRFTVDYKVNFRACALLPSSSQRQYQSSSTYVVGPGIGSVSEAGPESDTRITLSGGSVRILRSFIDVRGERDPGVVGLYGIKVALIHDGGMTSDAGSLSLLKFPRGETADFSNRQDPDCVRKELDEVEKIFAYQSLKSPALVSYKQALEAQLYAS